MNFTVEFAQQLLDSSDKFSVDFNLAWAWLGFKQRDNAKESFFNTGFIEGEEYLCFQVEPTMTDNGGTATENILLTIDCLRLWGMAAGTIEGREIRKRFLECEKAARQPISILEKVPAFVATEQKFAYIKSREWEKTEMANFQAPARKVKNRTGYRRAIDIVRDITEKTQDDVISW